MLPLREVNHIGIRIADKAISVPFYERLGFVTQADAGFDDGHPIIMRHASGVVLNLLGPATVADGSNVLMDVDEKHPGITHVALTVESLTEARNVLEEHGVPITGSFSFGNMSAIFFRDPDRTVIELDAYGDGSGDADYSEHP